MSPALKRIFFLLALGLTGAYLFRTFAFETIYLASDSMAPTLRQGDEAVVEKFVYFFRSPRRGEVVMFIAPVKPNKGMVKRVIAVQNDELEIRRKEVFINGKPLNEPYVQHTRLGEMLEGDNLGPLTVPEGHVFVMGDNRDVSGDSRDWKNDQGQRAPYLPVRAVQGLVRAK